MDPELDFDFRCQEYIVNGNPSSVRSLYNSTVFGPAVEIHFEPKAYDTNVFEAISCAIERSPILTLDLRFSGDFENEVLAEAIGACTDLCALRVRACRISPNVLRAFLKCSSLRRLTLRECILEEKAVKVLHDKLLERPLEGLEFFDVTFWRGSMDLFEAFGALKVLSIKRSKIGEDGAMALSETLKNEGCCLDTLTLEKVDLTEVGRLFIEDGVKHSKSMRRLVIDNKVYPDFSKLGEPAPPVPQIVVNKPSWNEGCLVWAKTGGFAWWPAQVIKKDKVPPELRSKHESGYLIVEFFGTHQYAAFRPNNLRGFAAAYQSSLEVKEKKERWESLRQEAIAEALEANAGLGYPPPDASAEDARSVDKDDTSSKADSTVDQDEGGNLSSSDKASCSRRSNRRRAASARLEGTRSLPNSDDGSRPEKKRRSNRGTSSDAETVASTEDANPAQDQTSKPNEDAANGSLSATDPTASAKKGVRSSSRRRGGAGASAAKPEDNEEPVVKEEKEEAEDGGDEQASSAVKAETSRGKSTATPSRSSNRRKVLEARAAGLPEKEENDEAEEADVESQASKELEIDLPPEPVAVVEEIDSSIPATAATSQEKWKRPVIRSPALRREKRRKVGVSPKEEEEVVSPAGSGKTESATSTPRDFSEDKQIQSPVAPVKSASPKPSSDAKSFSPKTGSDQKSVSPKDEKITSPKANSDHKAKSPKAPVDQKITSPKNHKSASPKTSSDQKIVSPKAESKVVSPKDSKIVSPKIVSPKDLNSVSPKANSETKGPATGSPSQKAAPSDSASKEILKDTSKLPSPTGDPDSPGKLRTADSDPDLCSRGSTATASPRALSDHVLSPAKPFEEDATKPFEEELTSPRRRTSSPAAEHVKEIHRPITQSAGACALEHGSRGIEGPVESLADRITEPTQPEEGVAHPLAVSNSGRAFVIKPDARSGHAAEGVAPSAGDGFALGQSVLDVKSSGEWCAGPSAEKTVYVLSSKPTAFYTQSHGVEQDSGAHPPLVSESSMSAHTSPRESEPSMSRGNSTVRAEHMFLDPAASIHAVQDGRNVAFHEASILGCPLPSSAEFMPSTAACARAEQGSQYSSPVPKGPPVVDLESFLQGCGLPQYLPRWLELGMDLDAVRSIDFTAKFLEEKLDVTMPGHILKLTNARSLLPGVIILR